MGKLNTFYTDAEAQVSDAVLNEGHIIRDVENKDGLEAIRELVAHSAARHLGIDPPADPGLFLNTVQDHVSVDKLNNLRLAVIGALRSEDWFRPTFFSLARDMISTIVGNELAMQRGIGLSVQLPDDDSSLLPVHADTWDGDSPYEIVAWLPLVDCFRTKSMYLLPPSRQADHLETMAGSSSAEEFYRMIENDVTFLDVPFGKILLFRLDLPHGNRINREPQTRWTMNCRFKGVLTPYADKPLGEFFEPILLRPATKVGLQYTLPRGFDRTS